MPASKTISISMPPEVYAYIAAIAQDTGRSFASVARSMLTEIYRDDMGHERAVGKKAK